MIKFILLIGISDIIFQINSSLLRIIGLEHIQFLIGGFLFPLLIIVFGYFFCITLGLENIGICIGWSIGHFFIACITAGIYYKFGDKILNDIEEKNVSGIEIELVSSFGN